MPDTAATLQDRVPLLSEKLDGEVGQLEPQACASNGAEATSSEEPTEERFAAGEDHMQQTELSFLADAAARVEGGLADILSHPDLAGFLNVAEDDVSALLRQVRQEVGPLYTQAEALLASKNTEGGKPQAAA